METLAQIEKRKEAIKKHKSRRRHEEKRALKNEVLKRELEECGFTGQQLVEETKKRKRTKYRYFIPGSEYVLRRRGKTLSKDPEGEATEDMFWHFQHVDPKVPRFREIIPRYVSALRFDWMAEDQYFHPKNVHMKAAYKVRQKEGEDAFQRVIYTGEPTGKHEARASYPYIPDRWVSHVRGTRRSKKRHLQRVTEKKKREKDKRKRMEIEQMLEDAKNAPLRIDGVYTIPVPGQTRNTWTNKGSLSEDMVDISCQPSNKKLNEAYKCLDDIFKSVRPCILGNAVALSSDKLDEISKNRKKRRKLKDGTKEQVEEGFAIDVPDLTKASVDRIKSSMGTERKSALSLLETRATKGNLTVLQPGDAATSPSSAFGGSNETSRIKQVYDLLHRNKEVPSSSTQADNMEIDSGDLFGEAADAKILKAEREELKNGLSHLFGNGVTTPREVKTRAKEWVKKAAQRGNKSGKKRSRDESSAFTFTHTDDRLDDFFLQLLGHGGSAYRPPLQTGDGFIDIVLSDRPVLSEGRQDELLTRFRTLPLYRFVYSYQEWLNMQLEEAQQSPSYSAN